MAERRVLAVSNDAKTILGVVRGYLTGILYFAPNTVSGYQVCPMASNGCATACIYHTGRGAFTSVQNGRIRKTRLFFEDRPQFLSNLFWSIRALIRKAKREKLVPVVRLNGTSDIVWENIAPELFSTFPSLTFYDYSKRPGRTLPPNYSLTFSRSEENAENVASEIARGVNIAVVFDTRKGQPLPATWAGLPVIDGDLSDLRFLDPPGVIVGLRAKGPNKSTGSGFIISTHTQEA